MPLGRSWPGARGKGGFEQHPGGVGRQLQPVTHVGNVEHRARAQLAPAPADDDLAVVVRKVSRWSANAPSALRNRARPGGDREGARGARAEVGGSRALGACQHSTAVAESAGEGATTKSVRSCGPPLTALTITPLSSPAPGTSRSVTPDSRREFPAVSLPFSVARVASSREVLARPNEPPTR